MEVVVKFSKVGWDSLFAKHTAQDVDSGFRSCLSAKQYFGAEFYVMYHHCIVKFSATQTVLRVQNTLIIIRCLVVCLIDQVESLKTHFYQHVCVRE